MVLDGPFSSTITVISDDFSPVHPSLPSLLPSTRMAFEPGKASLDLMHPMVHLKMQLQNSVQRHVLVTWKWFPRLLHSVAASRQQLQLFRRNRISPLVLLYFWRNLAWEGQAVSLPAFLSVSCQAKSISNHCSNASAFNKSSPLSPVQHRQLHDWDSQKTVVPLGPVLSSQTVCFHPGNSLVRS